MDDEKRADWGSWAANDEQTLTMGLRATPAERLAWQGAASADPPGEQRTRRKPRFDLLS